MKQQSFIIAVILACLVFAFTEGIAQTKTEKTKKVVVKTEKNENGNTTKSEKIAEGEEAEALLKELEAEGIDVNELKKDGSRKVIVEKSTTSKTQTTKRLDGDTEVEIIKNTEDGSDKEKYTIIRKKGDKKEVIEWDGKGEMPDEIKNEVKIIKKAGKKDMGYVDEEIKIELAESGFPMPPHPPKLNNRGMNTPNIEWQTRNMHQERGMNNYNKATIGIIPQDTDNGVIIDDIVANSGAEKCGLRRGDTILKVNNAYIFSVKGLHDSLKPFNPGEKVKVTVLRDGKEKSEKITLQAR